jgi:uncharacterized membrane protein
LPRGINPGNDMTASLFPWLRMLHILFAALWLGSAAFLTLYLLPALRQLGPAGSATLRSLDRRGLHRFMGAVGGVSVLSGLWLYWTLTGGFNAQAIGSHTGMVYGLGGLAGLLAAVIGGGVIGRSIKRLDALTDAPGAGADEAIALQRRIAIASRCALALLFVALVAMTLGHAV